MQQEQKYFTPTLNDLRAGLAFEIQGDYQGKSTWLKCKIGEKHSLERFERGMNDCIIRCKHLDEQDLEYLGFERIRNIFSDVIEFRNNDTKIHFSMYNTCVIWKLDYVSSWIHVFQGIIKTKAHLKEILD